MESSGVTSINDLPKNDNIQLSISENNSNQSINMNDIFKELQDSSKIGELPSRDIPINTNNISLDNKSTPNYIPTHESYLNENDFEDADEMIESERKYENRKSSLETLYEELQVPILLGVIYFLFQLPIFNDILAKYLAFTFNGDGTINLQGIFLKSILFSIIYFTITKALISITY